MTADDRGVGTSSRAAALTRSPRGLVVLARLCGDDLDLWSSSAPPPDVPRSLGAGLAVWRHDPDVDRLVVEERGERVLADPEALAAEVTAAVDGLAWWGDRARLGELVGHGGVFAAAADALLAAPGSRWWPDDLARDEQVVLGPPDVPPDLVALAGEQERLSRVPWRLPQALTSSRRLGDRLPSARLAASEATARRPGPVGCWAVAVDPDARVVEIHGPEDWRDLCARYPRRGPTPPDYARWGVGSPTAVAPDWELVRRDWDGLHVSMLGVLVATGVPVDVDGAGAVLEDVDSELTAWFRPRLEHPRLLAVREHGDLP